MLRMPVIRVSAAAMAELKRLAVEEGRTVVSIVDRWLGVQAEAPAAQRRPGAAAPVVEVFGEAVRVASDGSGAAGPGLVATCVCGHGVALHLVKGTPGRCQHPRCYPNGCRAFRETA